VRCGLAGCDEQGDLTDARPRVWMTSDHMALEVRPCDTRTLPKVLPSDGTGSRAAAAAETASRQTGHWMSGGTKECVPYTAQLTFSFS